MSALQHLLFCERQCALIHLEQVWAENRWTAEGRVLHERAHDGGTESRGEVTIARGVRLRSLALGLVGQADVVEFHRELDGSVTPFPVEYKRGKPKAHRSDEVQLCAQAMALEEMLGVSVPHGALFYGRPRRRTEVDFDATLRALTVETAERLHALMTAGRTPPAMYGKHCETCSLIEQCRPRETDGGRSVEAYLRELLSR